MMVEKKLLETNYVQNLTTIGPVVSNNINVEVSQNFQ